MKELYFEINTDGMTSGSVAYDLSAFAAPAPQRREREETHTRRRTAARPQEKTKGAFPVFAVIGSAVCVVLMSMVIGTCAQLNEINNAIVTQRAELQRLQQEAGDMAERYNTTVNLEEVERYATEELGMVYASAEQSVYLDLSGDDQIRSYGNGGFLSRLRGIFD